VFFKLLEMMHSGFIPKFRRRSRGAVTVASESTEARGYGDRERTVTLVR
jgi:hypothetical protein